MTHDTDCDAWNITLLDNHFQDKLSCCLLDLLAKL
jgi:hypothetical protein